MQKDHKLTREKGNMDKNHFHTEKHILNCFKNVNINAGFYSLIQIKVTPLQLLTLNKILSRHLQDSF